MRWLPKYRSSGAYDEFLIFDAARAMVQRPVEIRKNRGIFRKNTLLVAVIGLALNS